MKRAGVAAVAGAVIVAFGGGVVTGAATRGGHPSAGGDTVVDQAERAIEAHAAKPVSASALQQAAVEGMLKALGDPWSAYYEPSQFARFQQTLSGSYSGVGLWVRRTTSGVLRIESVQGGSPADVAGMRSGDVLTAVGGLPVTGRTVADVVAALRGRPGTAVTVEVDRDGRHITDVLSRSRISDDDVSANRIGPGVERLRIVAFTSGVGRWVRARVREAAHQHLRGIVLDLRDNPGGLLTEAVETASAFLASGPVVSYVQRGSSPDVLNALGGGNTAIPLVVLVDGGTASAAEIVAGALQDRGRAVIVGSQTFGKGSVQAPNQLSDGSDIELTVGHYLTPDGRSLDGVGISPDVLVGPQEPQASLYQRAIEVLSGLTADAGSAG
ncbi:MAG TPA: S41 family peptidase [Mycobacteriales bacterium]|jgi:carboxyl-terminal processing protease|nr:S41 family peptidase [Mycobacteriales bacterium]